jgi:hypothetical protein
LPTIQRPRAEDWLTAVKKRRSKQQDYRRPQEGSVPDRRRRILPEVVFVRRWVIGVLGIWRGEGTGEGWNRGGQFTSNLRPRWTDPVTARRVPSK